MSRGFRADASLYRLIPRIECFMCEGDPDPCPDCAGAMLASLDTIDPRAARAIERDEAQTLERVEAEIAQHERRDEVEAEYWGHGKGAP